MLKAKVKVVLASRDHATKSWHCVRRAKQTMQFVWGKEKSVLRIARFFIPRNFTLGQFYGTWQLMWDAGYLFILVTMGLCFTRWDKWVRWSGKANACRTLFPKISAFYFKNEKYPFILNGQCRATSTSDVWLCHLQYFMHTTYGHLPLCKVFSGGIYFPIIILYSWGKVPEFHINWG